jgi:hypothetical protein
MKTTNGTADHAAKQQRRDQDSEAVIVRSNERTTEELKAANREAYAELAAIRGCQTEIRRRLQVKIAYLYDRDEDDYFSCYAGHFRFYQDVEETLYVFRSLPDVARGLATALDWLAAERREQLDRAAETSRELEHRAQLKAKPL